MLVKIWYMYIYMDFEEYKEYNVFDIRCKNEQKK